MVNKENLRLLVAALRSGQFTQGRGVLKSTGDDGDILHCCLGVGCEVAMANGIRLRVTSYPHCDRTGWAFDAHTSHLPSEVAGWYGIRANPMIGPKGTSAVMANDCLGWDFNQIADAFETYYGLLEEGDDTPGTD